MIFSTFVHKRMFKVITGPIKWSINHSPGPNKHDSVKIFGIFTLKQCQEGYNNQ